MKNLLLITALVAFVLTSCTSGGQKQGGEARGTGLETTEVAIVYSADTLYAVAESFLDQPITVKGFVTHVCSHAGKRCFLTGVDQKYTIRVEAMEELGSFNKELTGTEVVVDGVLRERRLTRTEIDDMEKDVNKRMEDDEEEGAAEACQAELANINEMKEWMQERGKDYYAIYYVEGLSYRKAGD
ncbi:MAG: hypothetical protein QM237_04235 [Bacteroidota bacterium]|jgi:hypothetical protein|nr:hypothetical protein [Bacteroidota bacterium]HHU97229.1 hypothetical protein [Petrimonas sp.]